MRLVELAVDKRIVSVGHEINSRGWCYVALDRRRTFLLVSTNLVHTMEAIEVLTNEAPSKTCLYDSASMRHRGGYHKSFNIEKTTKERLSALVDEHRGHFQRVVICCLNPGAWRIGQRSSQILSDNKQEDVCNDDVQC